MASLLKELDFIALPFPLALPWGIFLGYWLVTAFFANKTTRREPFKTRLPVVALNLIFWILLFTQWCDSGIFAIKLIPDNPVTFPLGVLFTWFGTAFAIWARYTIGKFWSASVTLKQGHELVTSGPYAFVRHPIYTGFVLAILGTALAIGEVRTVLAFIICVPTYIFKMRVEERLMREHFGMTYDTYTGRTRALIPFLW